MTEALTAACHCGRVTVRAAMRPDYINECNCSLCGKSGAWWGYYSEADVEVAGETATYSRTDREKPSVVMHFCERCGCTTHWRLTPPFASIYPKGQEQMGANMRLFDRAALAGTELRFPDGRAWDGKGAFGYVRAAEIL